MKFPLDNLKPKREALEGQFRFPISTQPQPDMVLFKRGVPSERHPSPNEIYLVVEVSETTLKQDEGKKLLAYQDAGIPEYWIVDVAAKVVRIHRLKPSQNLL